MQTLTSIDDLLEQMVSLGASDLHVTVGSPPAYRVRGRIVRADDILTVEDQERTTVVYGKRYGGQQ